MKRLLPFTLLALSMTLWAVPPAAAQDAGPGDRPDPPRERGEPGPDGPRERERGDRGDRGPRGERDDRGERDGRGERGGPDDRGRDDRRWHLTPEELGQAIQIIDRMNPELAERLRAAQAQSPERAVRQIAEEFPKAYELLRMRAEDPERYELHVQSFEVMRDTGPLVRRLRQAQRDEDGAAVEELTGQIKAMVERMFDIRVALRRLEIRDLRERIAELEGRLAEQEQDRASIIEERTESVVTGDFGGRRGERGEHGERGDHGERGGRDNRGERGDRGDGDNRGERG